MKFKTILYTISFISLMFIHTPIFAQDSNYDVISKEFTMDQRELLQKEREVMKANRKAFKATLSNNQLAILSDKTISKSQIRKRLMVSFSTTQKELVKNQQLSLRKTRDNFRKTLTIDQRKMLKERIDKIRKSKDRGELKVGVRELGVKNQKKRRKRTN